MEPDFDVDLKIKSPGRGSVCILRKIFRNVSAKSCSTSLEKTR